MKKKILSLAMAVAMLFSLTAMITPVVSIAAVGDAVTWDIVYNGGTSMTISWQPVAGASSYTIERGGAMFATAWTQLQTGNTSRTFTDTGANANKYENYYRITPNAGAAFYISLEGKIFGPNVRIYDSKYHTGAAAATDINSRNYNTAEMGTQRWAYMFKPGNYNEGRALANYLTIGFYVSVYGLGKVPTDTTIGSVQCPTNGMGNNATQTFWRSIENVYVQYGISNDGNNCFRWAVSQAAPARRLQFDSAQLDWDNGWCSGGFLADSRILGAHGSYSGQQYYYRNNNYGTAPYGFTNWHFTFEGDTGAGVKADSGNAFASGKTTTFATVQGLMREKPFVYLDGDAYKVFVPGWRNNASGPSWTSADMGVGTSLDLLDEFYIAYPANTAEEINDALRDGKNLLLTPGIYVLSEPIVVGEPNTVVLGLGYATVVPAQSNQWGAMDILDVEGVTVSGVMFDSYYSSVYQLRVGEEGLSDNNNVTNPIILHDVFFRVGGFQPAVCQVDVSLQINANGAILDHAWIWRADHGAGWTGWEVAKTDYGLFVSGDYVTCHGLFNEHYRKYGTFWEGEYGKTIFLQNETPYDPGNNKGNLPNPPGTAQSAYMSHKGTVEGYAQYKVANKVDNHYAAGLGSYATFTQLRDGGGQVWIKNAYEVPIKPGVYLYHIQNINIGTAGVGQFRSMVNGVGPAATGTSSVYMNYYPDGTGTQPPDYADDPDLVAPSYDDRSIGYPPGVISYMEGPSVRFVLANLAKDSTKIELNTDYSATLLVSSNYGYYVPGSISVTMNGVELNAGTDYTYTPSGDSLSAAIWINGDLIDVSNYNGEGQLPFVITAAGEYDASSIEYSVANASADGPATLYNGLPFSATLTAADGYILPASVTVTMGGSPVTAGYALSADKKSATVTLAAITGDVVVSGAAIANFATITYNLSGVSRMADAPDIVTKGFAAGIPLQAANGNFTLPAGVTVTMGGNVLVAGVDYSYTRQANNMSGIILIYAVTDDVTIAAVGAGTGALPASGNDIYLVALRNGKVVRAIPGGDPAASVADVDTFVSAAANPASVLRVNYITGTGVNAGQTIHGLSNGGYALTIEGSSYGGSQIRFRTGGTGEAAGWASPQFQSQPDGTVKIFRNTTTGDAGGVGALRWADVEESGRMVAVQGTVGDTGKFNWYLTSQIIDPVVNRADLLSAINFFKGLDESLYTAGSWALAAAELVLAEDVFADAGASQATVDAAAADMWAAINALVLDDEGVAPTITTSSLPDGKVGVAYSATLAATGDAPITWSSSALPAGLSLNAATGEIYGTPTAAGTFEDITITATNDAGYDNKAFVIVVADADPIPEAPSITTSSLPNGTVGVAYSATVNATGDAPISFSATGLPAGLSISDAGVISGTPEIAGTFSVTVTATNDAGSDSATFTVVIAPDYVGDDYIALAQGQAMSIKLAVGASVQLDIDSNLTDLVYSCATTYVIVDANGVVTGIKGGMAVITVTSASKPNLKVNVVVTVS